jgi:hypothetical protein
LESNLDGDNAIFWVKVTEDLDSDRTIYVYYGNSYAASLSSQANTFVDVISGVVGAWNMEESLASDPVIDYSGNGNDGTPTGTTIINGKFAGKTMRSLNGISDSIFLAESITNNVYSISFYVKPESNIAAPYFYDARLPTGSYQWASWDGTNFLSSGDLYIDTILNGVVTNNVYSAVIVNNTTLESTNGIFLGCRFSGTDLLQGILGMFILYNHSLTSNNIINLQSNYPDVSLEAGKVLVRKYSTTALPTHGDWGTELSLPCYCSRHARRRRLKRGR